MSLIVDAFVSSRDVAKKKQEFLSSLIHISNSIYSKISLRSDKKVYKSLNKIFKKKEYRHMNSMVGDVFLNKILLSDSKLLDSDKKDLKKSFLKVQSYLLENAVFNKLYPLPQFIPLLMEGVKKFSDFKNVLKKVSFLDTLFKNIFNSNDYQSYSINTFCETLLLYYKKNFVNKDIEFVVELDDNTNVVKQQGGNYIEKSLLESLIFNNTIFKKIVLMENNMESSSLYGIFNPDELFTSYSQINIQSEEKKDEDIFIGIDKEKLENTLEKLKNSLVDIDKPDQVGEKKKKKKKKKVNESENTPVSNPENTPVSNPENTPVTPENTPVSNPENTPVSNPENTPVTPENGFDFNSGDDATLTPKNDSKVIEKIGDISEKLLISNIDNDQHDIENNCKKHLTAICDIVTKYLKSMSKNDVLSKQYNGKKKLARYCEDIQKLYCDQNLTLYDIYSLILLSSYHDELVITLKEYFDKNIRDFNYDQINLTIRLNQFKADFLCLQNLEEIIDFLFNKMDVFDFYLKDLNLVGSPIDKFNKLIKYFLDNDYKNLNNVILDHKMDILYLFLSMNNFLAKTYPKVFGSYKINFFRTFTLYFYKVVSSGYNIATKFLNNILSFFKTDNRQDKTKLGSTFSK